MFNQKSTKGVLIVFLAISIFASCKKEEVSSPNESLGGQNTTIIFIRAVDKDSSVVESQQLLLR